MMPKLANHLETPGLPRLTRLKSSGSFCVFTSPGWDVVGLIGVSGVGRIFDAVAFPKVGVHCCSE
jgi:hypothetical protein